MTTDNPRPARNYSLFLPLLIGIISLLGISLILVSVWFSRQNTEVVPTQAMAPFKYLLLATLTSIPTIKVETAAPTEILSAPTGISEENGALTIPTLTEQTEISTNGGLFTATVTVTPNPIFSESVPMMAGTYDDTDFKIIRNGNWISQNNLDAYQGTLLVSNAVGNYVAFSFTGQQMALGFQSNDNAGDLAVNIDGSEMTITQLVGNEWISQELIPGAHFVILTHKNGIAVNLDYVNILY